MSIYRNEQDLLRIENRIKNSDTLTPEQKKSAIDFENFLFSKSLSIARVLRYMNNLNVIYRQFPDIDISNLSKSDIISVIAWTERHYKNENTKNSYKYTLRKFLDWQGLEYRQTVPINRNIRHSKLPEELFTEQEIVNMINSTFNPRDAGFISSIYEAGARIGEHGNPKLKHIIRDEYGIVLMVDGKTGMRRIRLIWSVPFLIQWLECHPQKDDPEAYLWVQLKKPYEQLEYQAFAQIIKRAAKNAGIKKRVYPHLFRHTRSTHLASHLTESQMKIYLGWAGDSRMPKIYVHLSGKDVDDAILNLYGIKPPEDDRVPLLKVTSCPRCKQTVPEFSGFCNYCGFAFSLSDTQRMYEMEQKAKELALKLVEENPELASLLFKPVNED